jgi:hypothetical protein
MKSAANCRARLARSGCLPLALLMCCASCASTVNGRRQEVAFSSDPPGAEVIVDGADLGTTPAVIDLARHHDHTVRIEKPGYVAYEMTTTSSLTNWGWTYLPVVIFPPAIFILFADDGAFEIVPHEVTANLVAAPSPAEPSK